MRTLAIALAVTSLFASATTAMAQGKSEDAPGKQPKVCLLTFSSADQFGADASVTKAQYLPLPIAQKLRRDEATQGIAYYGFGALTAEQQAAVNFYFPDGSLDPAIGVSETSDTQTLCEAFMAYADQNSDEQDD